MTGTDNQTGGKQSGQSLHFSRDLLWSAMYKQILRIDSAAKGHFPAEVP